MAKYKTFPELIRWIADTYHDGVVDAIAGKAHISPALADKWVKGKVRAPKIDTLNRLCTAYNLPLHEVMRVAYDLGKRGAALLLILGALLLCAHDIAHAESAEVDITNARYRKRRYSGWWAAVKLTTRGWSGFDRTPIGGFPRIDRIVAVA